MKETHNLKNNPTNRFPTPKIYKKEVLHEILRESDQKFAVYNRSHPVADASSYFGDINPISLRLYGKYHYYDLNKFIFYINAFKNEFHWGISGWNKWILAFHRDWWRPFWILLSRKFRPPFKKRRRSLFFYKYLKLPKTTVKPYLHKVGHGIRVLDPTSSTVQGENTDRHYVLMSGNEIKSENRITNIVKHHRQTSSARAANNLPII